MTGSASHAVPAGLARPGAPAGSGMVTAGGVRPARAGLPGTNPVGAAQEPDFAAEFRRQLESVQLSQHARQRLASRGIALGPEERSRLAGAVRTLASKGGRTSLVLIDGLALVVSIPNRTVITAVRGQEHAVFTNIDSAITA